MAQPVQLISPNFSDIFTPNIEIGFDYDPEVYSSDEFSVDLTVKNLLNKEELKEQLYKYEIYLEKREKLE